MRDKWVSILVLKDVIPYGLGDSYSYMSIKFLYPG